jgi:hypothetical protein
MENAHSANRTVGCSCALTAFSTPQSLPGSHAPEAPPPPPSPPSCWEYAPRRRGCPQRAGRWPRRAAWPASRPHRPVMLNTHRSALNAICPPTPWPTAPTVRKSLLLGRYGRTLPITYSTEKPQKATELPLSSRSLLSAAFRSHQLLVAALLDLPTDSYRAVARASALAYTSSGHSVGLAFSLETTTLARREHRRRRPRLSNTVASAAQRTWPSTSSSCKPA